MLTNVDKTIELFEEALRETGNDYIYFELAYTRTTGWMCWLLDKTGGEKMKKYLATGQASDSGSACVPVKNFLEAWKRNNWKSLGPRGQGLACPYCKGTGKVIAPPQAPPGNYPYVLDGRNCYAPSNIITSQTLYDEVKRKYVDNYIVWTVDDFAQEVIGVRKGRSIDLTKSMNHFISKRIMDGKPTLEEFRINSRKAVCASSPAQHTIYEANNGED